MACFVILKSLWIIVMVGMTFLLYVPLMTHLFSSLKQSKDKTTQLPEVKKIAEPLEPNENVVCHDLAPKPIFLKVPRVKNSSCIKTSCLDSKLINWKMVTFVKSAVRNFALREFIRRTWGSVSFLAGAQFQTVFVLGNADEQKQALIDEEERRYHDILQIDTPDVYRNLAQKTLGAMYWASKNLPNAYLFSEADDDILVNLYGVVINIDEFQTNTANRHWPEFPMVCMSKRQAYDTPQRKKHEKHYYSMETYRWPFWPDYCLGGMFTVSVAIARDLWKASRTEEPMGKEDMWLTGILREKIGMSKQMLKEARPNPATHYHGFSAEKPQKNMELMEHHWKKIKQEIESKDFCLCEQKE